MLKSRQDALQGDIEELKKNVAAWSTTALHESDVASNSSTCNNNITDDRITYDEVKNVIDYLQNKVAENELVNSTVKVLPTSNSPYLTVPTLKSIVEKKLKDALNSNSTFNSQLTAAVTKILNLESRWSQIDSDIIAH